MPARISSASRKRQLRKVAGIKAWVEDYDAMDEEEAAVAAAETAATFEEAAQNN